MRAMRYFKQHRDYFIGQIGEIIGYKSISTDPAFKSEVVAAAKWVQAKLQSLGFTVQIIETSSNPIIIGRRVEDAKLPTVLLYGHYDVQPVAPLADWLSDPFTLTERDGKFFARGIVDNKGQFMMHMTALEAMLNATGKLPANVVFLIEGDEETGSADLDTVIASHRKQLQADIALISDGEFVGEGTPAIEASFRGVINCELTVFGPREDMHSGIVGGAIANPAMELTKVLAKLYDANHRVTLEGFYDDVLDITLLEKAAIQAKRGTEADFLQLTGSPKLHGEAAYTHHERTGLRPTLQVTGITAGYGGVGFKNIVPAKANAKLNFRLVAHQDPQKIFAELQRFLATHLPDTVRYELSDMDAVQAVKIDLDTPYMHKTRTLLHKVYGVPPEINFVGGTLPVIKAIKEYLDIPILSVPLAQEDCGMHSPNERLTHKAFEKGVEFSIAFFESL